MIDQLKERLTSATHNAPDTETALDHVAGLYQEAASLIEALKAFQGECKDAIGGIFVETGTTEAVTSTARLYVTRPSVRITYDRTGLDELCANDDELATVLEPYRRETVVDGTLVIRTGRQG